MLRFLLIMSSFLILSGAYANSYSGLQNRALKALSNDDVLALQSGAGWGLAKPAELNGVPGPAHLLEFTGELGLSINQQNKIQQIWNQMNADAKRYGEYYLQTEEKIEALFHNPAEENISSKLEEILKESANYLSKLRAIHLNAHLDALPLLTAHQIMQYQQLRGYTETAQGVSHAHKH